MGAGTHGAAAARSQRRRPPARRGRMAGLGQQKKKWAASDACAARCVAARLRSADALRRRLPMMRAAWCSRSPSKFCWPARRAPQPTTCNGYNEVEGGICAVFVIANCGSENVLKQPPKCPSSSPGRPAWQPRCRRERLRKLFFLLKNPGSTKISSHRTADWTKYERDFLSDGTPPVLRRQVLSPRKCSEPVGGRGGGGGQLFTDPLPWTPRSK